MNRAALCFAVASSLAAAATTAHAAPSCSLEGRAIVAPAEGEASAVSQDGSSETPRGRVEGGLGLQLGPAGIANTGHGKVLYRVYGPIVTGVFMQGTLRNNGGMEGCSTFDCSKKLFDAHAVAEAHAFPSSPVDIWAGVQLGPSFLGSDHAGSSGVLFGFQGNVGLDLRLSLSGLRPVIGVGVGVGGYVADTGSTAAAGSVAWHAGLEF